MSSEKVDLFVLMKLRVLVKTRSKKHLILTFRTLQQYLRSVSVYNRLYLRKYMLIRFKNSEVF